MVRHLEHEVYECDRFTCFTIHQARNQLGKLDDQRKMLDTSLDQQQQQQDMSVATPISPSSKDEGISLLDGTNAASVTASQLASVGSISNALDTVQLELSDFVDLDLSHNWGTLTSISASASLTLLASKSMAGNVVTLLRLSSTMGTTTARRLMIAAATLIGLGSVFYMVSDMDATVRRKLSSRVSLMLEEEGFVQHHAERLTTETSRAIRPFVWHLQHTFQRMVEAEEHKRADHLRRRHIAQDSQIYFDELRIKAQELANAVRSVGSTESAGSC
ncbi:mitofusin [Coemansia sp. RSA 1722]|nr:mitofusin [Coemansia sp. RSA 1722]